MLRDWHDCNNKKAQELVPGLVFDKGSTKTAGGPSQVADAKVALIQ